MLHLRCPLDTQVEITEMQLVFQYPAQGCVETRDMKLGVTVMWLTEGESAYEEKRPQKRVFQPGEMEKERRKELKRRLKMSYLWIGREIQERAWSQKPEGERGREGLNWMLQETKVNTRDWPLPWATWTSLESWAAVHSLFHQRQAFEITRQLINTGCECHPRAPSPFPAKPLEREVNSGKPPGISWSHELPSVTGSFCHPFSPHEPHPGGLLGIFPACGAEAGWIRRRWLLISGWSSILYEIPKDFL